ncbi:Pycsar system effector family protein [Actinomadura sp. WAC 06369]|uniref:Pycsar system effector family protein n=1 Tax=Actinomadura sp. WAC 06369 TaxID=2203193 RepID=UPI000F79242F|nr:Pycsar system effector family protein [Actinomadura sp. WAC 06369]RSN53317.1 hypothetical protein DMH08_27690 [Actinomadura sp. WAC 06369]
MTAPLIPGDGLAAELAAVRAELARVDAKCGTLAGLAGAAVAFVATQVTRGPVPMRITLGAAGLVLAAAAVVLLACVLRPRLGASGFRRWVAMDAVQVADCHMEADQDLITSWQCEDLVVLSRICDRKNRRLRLAVDLIAFGVLLIAAGVVVGVIA